MKKILLAFFAIMVLLVSGENASAQKDTLTVGAVKGFDACRWGITVKNRNADGKTIDEIDFQITVADDNLAFYDMAKVTFWAESIVDNFNATYTATSAAGFIAPGANKSGFELALGIPSTYYDQPVRVKWVTKNSLVGIDSGFIDFICTQFQWYRNDSVSVVASTVNNDPHFNFTLWNRNDLSAAIARFAVKLETLGGGSMRPSRITAPTGWLLDSVTSLFAYFHAESQASYINPGDVLAGFNTALRGNPAKTDFDFVWWTYDGNGVPNSRDTLRNVHVVFSGTANESDSVKAVVQSGCLYQMTVKNYHVSNTAPPSHIRKVALWSKSGGYTLIGAPNAPFGWTKTVKTDSIIYQATADSNSIPSGIVTNQFSFNVDGPTAPFKIGWKTFKTLSTSDSLSSGTMDLQCQKDAPKTDGAVIAPTQNCCYQITVSNDHNQPPSNLTGIQISIPPGKGKLTSTQSSSGWNKSIENDTLVRFVAAGNPQPTGSTQIILFCIDPTTPGENFPVTWKTYDETGLPSGTSVSSGSFQIGCTPVVNKCDSVSYLPNGTDTCSYNFSFNNLRSQPMNHISFDVGNGWQIDTAMGPSGWTVQVLNGRTSANYQAEATGIPAGSTQNGFILKFSAVNKSDTFYVMTKRYDPTDKECLDNIMFICKSQTQESVHPLDLIESSVMVKPNPVEHDATLYFGMTRPGRVNVALLDVLGKQVQMIESSVFEAGDHRIMFSMKGLEAGSYYLRVSTPSGVVTKKIVLIQ